MKKNDLAMGEKIVLTLSFIVSFSIGLFFNLGVFIIIILCFLSIFIFSCILYGIRAKRQNKTNLLNKKEQTTKKIIENNPPKMDVELEKTEKIVRDNFDNNVINFSKNEIDKKIEQIKFKNKDRNDNYKYLVGYINEYEFKMLQRSLKKYNMLAYKKFVFEYYPKLLNGDLIGNIVSNIQDKQKTVYELKLPTDEMFAKVHGDITLQYMVYHNEKNNTFKYSYT